MKKMFCLIGLTGAGKSTYLNYILKYKKDYNLDNLNRLVYHTTRKPRPGEKEGVDYYFAKMKDKPVSLVGYTSENGGYLLRSNPDLIEERTYTTMNNGVVYYYTTTDCVTEDYYICAPSIEQLSSYLDYFGPDKIVVIEIDTEIKTRIRRVMEKRTTCDKDVYELCRRILQEVDDWEKADKDGMVAKRINNYLLIDNTIESKFQENANEILEYIKEQYYKDC